MAQQISADGKDQPGFCGLEGIFEFINGDGTLWRTNCGQAAAATLLMQQGRLAGGDQPACDIMNTLEKSFPPDQFFGLFGTGRTQVERICQRHGLRLHEIRGEDQLRAYLSRRRPVIVMLGVSAGRLWNRFDLPGGHWMVAYACDDKYVYLSNCDGGRMTWADFQLGWRSFVSRLIRMNNRGLTILGQE